VIQALSERRRRAPNDTALSEGHSSSNFANFPLKISQKQSVSIQLEFFLSPPLQSVNGTSKGKFIANAAGEG